MNNIRHSLVDLLDWFAYRHISVMRIVVAILVGTAMGAALMRALSGQPWPTTPATSTPVPIVVIATPLPKPKPPVHVEAVRYITVYSQPADESAFPDPIPQPPISAVVARYGSDWVMLPWDGNNVWAHAADVGLPDVADLQPPPPPPVPVVVYQPVYQPAPAAERPETPYQVMSDPQPAPAPTAAPVRAEDFVQPDPKARCAFIGCLGGN